VLSVEQMKIVFMADLSEAGRKRWYKGDACIGKLMVCPQKANHTA
jgi:hypothetical protein